MKGKAQRLTRLAGALATLALTTAGTALAQKFQYAYGGSQTETGRGGVQAVSSGGYIAVGESNSPSNGASNDIYLVRTDGMGNLLWSRTYDLGGDEFGNDVQECANGDFIIGGTASRGGCGNNDMLLMRVDRCGIVRWAKTFGDPGGFEEGWDVLETTSGDNVYTHPGDFVLAGSTGIGGKRDGFIVRADQNGALIWDATYDAGNDDYFYGVHEQQVNVDPGFGGDIIAAGGSNGMSVGGDYDGWIVRVSGADGQTHSPLHKMVSIGGGSDDEFKGVTEVTILNPGDIVAVGYTLSTSPNKEAYLVETMDDLCRVVVESSWGDAGPDLDEAFSVKEIPAGFSGPGVGGGDVVISGTTVTGQGGVDAFIGIATPGALGVSSKNYGGSGIEGGRSASAVMGSNCMTMGFVLCGFTESSTHVGPGDPRQLFLVKTDAGKFCACHTCEQEPSRTDHSMDDVPKCGGISYAKIGVSCSTSVARSCQTWQRQVCLDGEGQPDCTIPHCDNCDVADKPNIAGTIETTPSGLTMQGLAPNPVKAGATIDLSYSLLRDAAVTITVSDVSGRIVSSTRSEGHAGAMKEAIPTDGWATGVYMISVSSGAATATERVVVLEK
jgi:hypothetical protein